MTNGEWPDRLDGDFDFVVVTANHFRISDGGNPFAIWIP